MWIWPQYFSGPILLHFPSVDLLHSGRCPLTAIPWPPSLCPLQGPCASCSLDESLFSETLFPHFLQIFDSKVGWQSSYLNSIAPAHFLHHPHQTAYLILFHYLSTFNTICISLTSFCLPLPDLPARVEGVFPVCSPLYLLSPTVPDTGGAQYLFNTWIIQSVHFNGWGKVLHEIGKIRTALWLFPDVEMATLFFITLTHSLRFN